MTAADLIAYGMQPTQAKLFAPYMAPALEQFRIEMTEQRAGFLAQCMHESNGFTRLEESLYYTTPRRIQAMWPSRVPTLERAKALLRKPELLANTVYCDRYGNGSFTSGDGWRYRGRGLIQLTFRDNYAAASEALGRDYVARPEWVALPPDAVLTAAWFWASAGCNELMLRGLFDATTRRINPAMAGASDRRMQFARIAAEMLDASRALA